MASQTRPASVGRSSRPLLLLDVDGCISPLRITPPPGRAHIYIDVPEMPVKRVWVDAELSHWLKTLRPLFEMVWASSWEDKANESLGSALGLPRLPVIHFPDAQPRDSLTYKAESIKNFVGDQAFALVEDLLPPNLREWAGSLSAPTLLVETHSLIGIHEQHFRELLDFGQRLAQERGAISLIEDARAIHHAPDAQTVDPVDRSLSL